MSLAKGTLKSFAQPLRGGIAAPLARQGAVSLPARLHACSTRPTIEPATPFSGIRGLKTSKKSAVAEKKTTKKKEPEVKDTDKKDAVEKEPESREAPIDEAVDHDATQIVTKFPVNGVPASFTAAKAVKPEAKSDAVRNSNILALLDAETEKQQQQPSLEESQAKPEQPQPKLAEPSTELNEESVGKLLTTAGQLKKGAIAQLITQQFDMKAQLAQRDQTVRELSAKVERAERDMAEIERMYAQWESRSKWVFKAQVALVVSLVALSAYHHKMSQKLDDTMSEAQLLLSSSPDEGM